MSASAGTPIVFAYPHDSERFVAFMSAYEGSVYYHQGLAGILRLHIDAVTPHAEANR